MPPAGDGGATGGGGGGCSSHLARTLLLFLLWHTLTTISLLHSHPSPLPYGRRRRRPPPPSPPLARPHHHQPLRYTLQRRFSIINRKEFLIDAGVLKTAPFFSPPVSFSLLLFLESAGRDVPARRPPSPRTHSAAGCVVAHGVLIILRLPRAGFVCRSGYLSEFATGKTADSYVTPRQWATRWNN